MDDRPETKRHMTLIQIILLNAVVCGAELCASAGFTYIPPMLLKAGFAEQNMTILMGLGPLLGMCLVPVIGKWSDRCHSRFGRRRPFIFGLSVIILLSLILIPYGEECVSYLIGKSSTSTLIGAACLAVGVVLLDFGSQALFNPCEAMLSDACRKTSQSEQCFQVYAVMINIGGCIGYLITSLDWNKTTVSELFGNQEKSAFSILVVFFVLTLCITLAAVEEIPHIRTSVTGVTVSSNGADPGYETEGSSDGVEEIDDSYKLEYDTGMEEHLTPTKRTLTKQSSYSKARSLLSSSCERIVQFYSEKFAVCQKFVWVLMSWIYSKLPAAAQRQLDLPYVLKVMVLIEFFSWTSIYSFNLFYTDYVGQHVYKGNPNAARGSTQLRLYDEGVRMGSWGLFLHCVMSGIFATLMNRFTDRFGFKKVMFYGITSFTVAMVLMLLADDNIVMVTLMACVTGFGYAVFTTIPYSVITLYLEEPQLFFYEKYSDPNTKPMEDDTAGNIAVIDSAYFLSQVVLSAFMGYVVHYTGAVQSYIICAAIFGVIGYHCIKTAVFTRQEMLQHIRDRRRVHVEQII